MDLLDFEEREAFGEALTSALEKIGAVVFHQFQGRGKSASARSTEEFTMQHSGPDISLWKEACARTLLELDAVAPEQAFALVKGAAVSPEQARRSLDRLDTLEQNRPTLGQAARYGGIGAVGGAAIGALGNAIEHGAPLKGTTVKQKALGAAANAVKGALGGGAIPLVRSQMDRRAEMGTLRRFMRENTQG